MKRAYLRYDKTTIRAKSKTKITIMINLVRAIRFCCFLKMSSHDGEQKNLSDPTALPQTMQCRWSSGI